MSGKEGHSEFAQDFSNWMGQLPKQLHSIPLNTLAIPGSHDSAGFYLDKDGDIGPDMGSVLQELGKEGIVGTFLKEVLYKWSVTQSKTFTEQLQAGIRYLDMRICLKPGTEDFYTLHGLYGGNLETYLEEVNSFLDAHPKEVVIIDVNHTYDMDEFTHKQCMSMILGTLGHKMCPFTDVSAVTLERLWQKKQQVLMFYDDDLAKQNPMFWAESNILNPWPRTYEVKGLLAFLEKDYSQPRATDKFYVTQGVLTPTAYYIITHLIDDLKEDLDSKVALPFVDWLEQKKAGAQGINICILDYVEMADYIPAVLSLNT